ncbi:hypothetical protein [Herbiconiux sp. VKM Ac-2851]|uniref:hypothetical protein n=1 Tax=Herbiconiux sp. VKM Ac-2851 TaxID=2739025 RepID=UPI00156303F2|nr:hypothetical protein [Herbiconiux sp. VKM Ac-2851]NQX33875.1 hypothetical protein [Herbiconiux sp. VKM Ac-2851]
MWGTLWLAVLTVFSATLTVFVGVVSVVLFVQDGRRQFFVLLVLGLSVYVTVRSAKLCVRAHRTVRAERSLGS